jgi:hypothetical protein
VVVIALGLFLLVRARPDTGPLDPRSSSDDGTRALVLLLERQGATVEIVRGAPSPGDDARVLVLDDSLDDADRAALTEFVDAGGVVVVADPTSELLGDADAGAQVVEGELPDLIGTSARAESNVVNQECTIGALTELRGVFVRDGVLFPVSDEGEHCLGDDDHAFAIRRDRGEGTIVGLGDNALFTNELIRYGDNSGLAVALLAPREGASVDILLGSSVAKTVDEIGSGEESLGDLVRPGVWMGLAQLALAFVVLALARGIRPGRPVDEPLPSPLAGSESVRARATMMKRAGHHSRAGWLLRADLQRHLADRYHLPRDASASALDQASAARDGTEAGAIEAILTTEPRDAGPLLELSNRVARLRADHARADDLPATGGPGR